ncbi:hypothetical protein CPBF1521_37050 [Xanthomonas arboricola pv. juglandis]|nr:hypothetical protein CPBF1521_37050 [Xanthomonas arboricola pv. juglandis]SYZ62035.1 hypothetical protein CPBF427_42410 [Xanthomonas arboricola pv. juglandis]
MCRDSSSSGSLNCWRLASRSAPANRLIIGSYPGWRWNYDAKDRGFLELPYSCGEPLAMLVANPMISDARSAVTTNPIAASRDWPVTMR